MHVSRRVKIIEVVSRSRGPAEPHRYLLKNSQDSTARAISCRRRVIGDVLCQDAANDQYQTVGRISWLVRR